MLSEPRLTDQTVTVLRLMLAAPAQPRYGRDIAKETGLASGTLHPILSRLERAGWVESWWESPEKHEDAGRPRRRYYQLTSDGAQKAGLAVAAVKQRTANATAPRLRTQPAI